MVKQQEFSNLQTLVFITMFIAIFSLIVSLICIVNIDNKKIDLLKSNCSEIFESKCECMLDGGFWTEKNCEDYENSNYRNNGGRRCHSETIGYKCVGEIYFTS